MDIENGVTAFFFAVKTEIYIEWCLFCGCVIFYLVFYILIFRLHLVLRYYK